MTCEHKTLSFDNFEEEYGMVYARCDSCMAILKIDGDDWENMEDV